MNKGLLDVLENKIIDILKGEVKDIIDSTRKNMVVVEEKSDGDSATIADIKIGELFEKILVELLPNSIVIQEESFNEEVYKKALNTKYVWVLDPIDGTKAFRDPNNNEWCVGLALLEEWNPILSFVYIPNEWLEKSYLLSANKYRNELLNFGKKFNSNNTYNDKYVSHIHKDYERNEIEEKISSLYDNNEIIRAHAGHSTLAQFCEVAINTNKIFSRRPANIWDISQAAYLICKNDGDVFYENGESIFPLNVSKFELKDNHLFMPTVIACSLKNKNKILNIIK